MTPYLEKHALFEPLIKSPVPDDLMMVVVIPAYNESNLLSTLSALNSCEPPSGSVECVVVVNAGEHDKPEIKRTNDRVVKEIIQFRNRKQPWFKLYITKHQCIPEKKAGVGLARKIGMDEAVYRFEKVSLDGIIVNLDADCTCSQNYFTAIEDFFAGHPRVWSAGIYFEHHWMGESAKIRSAIVLYELHLRYLIAAQRLIGLPYAYQTIGSSMAVRSKAYQKRGGMNTRKAGEDFYFIHKFTSISRHAEILNTTVYPSARVSDRVPFGTGKAINKYLDLGQQLTSALDSFLDLKAMLDQLPQVYRSPGAAIDQLPKTVSKFFQAMDGLQRLDQIKKNTASFPTFRMRFFQWFNAFQLVKFLHFCRSHYPDRPVVDEASRLVGFMAQDSAISFSSAEELLAFFREEARSGC